MGLPDYSLPAFGTQRAGPSSYADSKGPGYRMGRIPPLGLIIWETINETKESNFYPIRSFIFDAVLI